VQVKYYILTIFLFTAGISISHGQTEISPLQTKIRLEHQVLTLGQALKLIGEEGRFSFSYGNKIPVQQEVSLENGEKTVQQVLDNLFRNIPVDYVERKDKILIVPRKRPTGVSQTVRGRIVDKDSGMPIPGVNVFIASPLKGAITNLEGNFRLEDIPVGRHNLAVSCMGYEGKNLPNLVVHSGKENVLQFELEESIIDIGEVTIRHEIDKLKPVNELAVVSVMPLSAEDLTYSPGALNDISRAVVSLPGVASSNDGQNHLIIRGNSPKGLLWRLEGIEIPNLNHFSDIGSSGGGISILSNNMIGRSDFFTGAFPAEYGNALSGVFDINLRSGNNEKHEQTFQVGVIGTEFMAEGPLNKRSGATYIGQFRYNTLALAHKIGLIENMPEFSDISFKMRMPTKHTGTFSIFGIGGRSHEQGPPDYHWYTDMATLGVANEMGLNATTRIKTIAAFSLWKYRWDSKENIGTALNPIDYNTYNDVRELTPTISMTLNKKISARHKFRTGVVYTHANFNSFMGWHSDTLANRALDPDHPMYNSDQNYEYIYSDAKGSTGIFQAFFNWRYRIIPNLTLNSGIHYIQLLLNNNNSIEPRLSLSWQFLPKHNLSAGFGIHSRRESFTLYTGEKTMHDGEKVAVNRDLELAKSHHFVLGYQYQPAQGLSFPSIFFNNGF